MCDTKQSGDDYGHAASKVMKYNDASLTHFILHYLQNGTQTNRMTYAASVPHTGLQWSYTPCIILRHARQEKYVIYKRREE
jgi:hypothetical protein